MFELVQGAAPAGVWGVPHIYSSSAEQRFALLRYNLKYGKGKDIATPLVLPAKWYPPAL
jgi:hypothetical protein